MDSQEGQLLSKIIPDNIIKAQRIAGFPKRNIIDGVIAMSIVGYLIHFIPFVRRVQVIVTAGVCGAIFVLFLFGIKGMSISECVVNIVLSKAYKHKYHLRSIRYARKNNPGARLGENAAVLNESIAEKGIHAIKNFIRDQKEKRQG